MSLQKIPSGPAGVDATLKIMRSQVRRWKIDPNLRRLALSIVGNEAQKDFAGELRRLHEWVRDRIRYVRDINGVETIHTPPRILENGQGDCDDKALLLATMLESIGHPTRFVAVGFRPSHYSHVLVETKLGARWIPLETTEPVSAGWSPPRVRARMVVHN